MKTIEKKGFQYILSDDGTASISRIRDVDNYDNLFGIHIPDVINVFLRKYIITSIGDLHDCSDIYIPSSVMSIDKLDCCYNTIIPPTIKTIKKLTCCKNITIPSSVVSLGDFEWCRDMKIFFPKGLTFLGNISGLNGALLPETVTKIGRMEYCSNIDIPSSVTSLGGLEDCENITIPSSVTSIGDITACKNIIIDFSPELKTLGKISGFNGVSIPNTIISIGDFDKCNNIIIPNSVKSIGKLSECTGITIPSSITSLSLIRISQVTIPSSVTAISEIDGENGATILKIKNKVPPMIGKIVNMAKDDHLYVPEGALETYKKHSVWGKFKCISEDPDLNKPDNYIQQPSSESNLVQNNNSAIDTKTKNKDIDAHVLLVEIIDLKKDLAYFKEENDKLKNENNLLKQQMAELSKAKQSIEKVDKTLQRSKSNSHPATIVEPSASNTNIVFKLSDFKSKGKMCHSIVKAYVEKNPDVTLEQLKQVFNVPKCNAIVESMGKAMTMTDSSGKAGGCHYIREADQIKIKEGIVVVWSYWPERYYPDFIINAKKAGFIIE